MAAPMRSLSFSIIRCLWKHNRALNVSGGRLVKCGQSVRNKSSEPKKSHYVALSSDESTVICYHPEPDFPYECTRPLPRKTDEISEGDSALKVQYRVQDHLRFRKDGPTDKELANMFFTTKHPWYPRPQKKYRRSKPPKDRDSI